MFSGENFVCALGCMGSSAGACWQQACKQGPEVNSWRILQSAPMPLIAIGQLMPQAAFEIAGAAQSIADREGRAASSIIRLTTTIWSSFFIPALDSRVRTGYDL